MTTSVRSKWIFAFILFNLLIVIFIIFLPPGIKVEVRNAFFSHKTDDTFFRMGLQSFAKNKDFKWSTDEIQKEFNRNTYFRKNMSSLVNSHLDDSLLAQKVVLLFSKNGSAEPSDCGLYSNNLEENIKWLNTNEGHGCCSDHAQVFIAMGLLAGLPVREVHNDSHTFNEFWDRQLNKWIWIDPQYWLMAKDSNGILLSLIEIQDVYRKGHRPNFYMFTNQRNYLNDISLNDVFNTYYSSDNFRVIRMTLGNNVFRVDKFNSYLNFLPKSLIQTILLSLDIQPGFVYYEYEVNLERKYHTYLFFIILYVLLILSVNFILWRNFKKKI